MIHTPRLRWLGWFVLGLAACTSTSPLDPRAHRGSSTFSIPTPPAAPSASASGVTASSAEVPPPVAPPDASLQLPPEPPRDEVLARAARRLAGLSAESDDPAQRARLEQHAKATDRIFNDFEQRTGKAMSAWADRHVPASEGGTVLYPFAGPDLITVHRLFPGANRHVLVALQEGGAPPSLEDLKRRELDRTLTLYERVFDAFSRRGFFLTMHLGAGYQTPRAARGICGVLLAFAEREKLQVIAVEPVRIRKDGDDLERHPGDRHAEETWSSLRIHLRREGGSRLVVDYVQMDLSDSALARDPAAERWLKATARNAVMLKAASHLPQEAGFSRVREALLSRATQIVQDETGIAYSLLEKVFEVKLYGAFKGVNGLFDGRPQRALQEAYEHRTDVEPLPFVLGYRKSAGSALMVATRRPFP